MKTIKKKLILSISILAVLFLISGCMSTSYNVATGERETVFYSTDKEVRLGRKLARRLERKYKLLDDEQEQKRIDKIGQKIAIVSDRQDLQYYFAIIKDEEINALALPGGYIFISSGLINATDSDDEIAAVLAHEVGHIAAYHSIKKMQGHFLYTFLKALTLTQKADQGFHRGGDFAYLSLMMQYSREFEKQADRLSVKYTKKAGFKPEAALTMMDKLEQIDKKKPLRVYTYFKTHPPIAVRKAVIREAITGKLDYEGYLNLNE